MKHICNRFGFFLILLLVSCGSKKIVTQKPFFIDKPILFDTERRDLSLQYLSERYGLDQEEPRIKPKMIVLHWTVIPSLEESFDTFYPAKLPNRPDIKSASALNVSAHFLVDRNGTIYRLLPEMTLARHVIGLNHCAIGIENVGGTENLPLTAAQVTANIKLVRYLAQKYEIDYLIGHYEYTFFEEHDLWLEKDAGYRTKKIDPGISFMQKVREATKDLNFKTVPAKK